MIDMYKEDTYFKEIYTTIQNPMIYNRSQWLGYMIQGGFLFKNNKLCIPKCSMRENLIKEKHSGGLSRHFGQNKTSSQVIGKKWKLMPKSLLRNGEFVNMTKEGAKTLGYISHFQYQTCLGMRRHGFCFRFSKKSKRT